MEFTLEALQEKLEQFKTGVSSLIETKIAEQSTKADEEVKGLKGNLEEIEKGLAAVKDEMKTKGSFGLPGMEYEKKNWSWARFFHAMYRSVVWMKNPNMPQMTASESFDKFAPFEKEVCAQYGKRRDMEIDEMAKSLGMSKRDFEADDGSKGGFLVPPELYSGDIIETTYKRTPILQMPVLRLTGLKGDLPIPRDTGNLTAYWVSETGKPTKTDSSFALEWLRPKKLGVFTKVSNRLVASSNEAIEALIREKMSRDASVKLSDGLTNGKGAESEPKGILQETGNMTASTNALATNGARFTVDKLLAMQQALAAADELRDDNGYGAIMRPEVYFGMLRERIRQYSAQSYKDGAPILPGTLVMDASAIESATGVRIGHTTQIATSTKGTSTTCSKVILGYWPYFAYASWRDPVFRVSDVAGDGGTGSAFLEDQLYMVMFMECDCRLLRPAAFTYVDDAETTESSW